MIRMIAAEELLAIRNSVLRDGRLTPDECRFATDAIDGAFHLGYYANEKLVGITSLFPQNYGEYTGTGYQLRGMATVAEHRGKGIGSQLLDFAVDYLRSKKAGYIWCNARKVALPFYRKKGFEILSEEFEVAAIGPHYVMHLPLAP